MGSMPWRQGSARALLLLAGLAAASFALLGARASAGPASPVTRSGLPSALLSDSTSTGGLPLACRRALASRKRTRRRLTAARQRYRHARTPAARRHWLRVARKRRVPVHRAIRRVR